LHDHLLTPTQDIIPSATGFHKQFLDLLRRIFVYDPSERITAHDALKHPWFKEFCVADDGSEAAKIKELRRNEAESQRLQAHATSRRNGY
jgi:dual-specificity kinase